ncbi:hypothetical protein HanXRQr2_Chr16g0761401 [Helianthus annuus]|uniref:Uncharacterized protein n=1 Tax=Helianthus annuus TaxID=4232 RepID=A0A251S0G6_HELAN|nr:hypothetical protein HanXRQr2_Chr16g0761401 [Helianthus annuus]KAJ0443999.1 hypothetical protein HanIR_Chr16g0826961 [Helianthus annuus]KAJ0822226.1 hypothetical protein HanPSC8_Chr16g0729541 [Helianthus annuus]
MCRWKNLDLKQNLHNTPSLSFFQCHAKHNTSPPTLSLSNFLLEHLPHHLHLSKIHNT